MLMLAKLVAHSAVLTSVIIVIAIVFLIIEAFSPHTYGALGVLGFCVLAGLLYAYDATGVGYWFGWLIVLLGIALVATEALGVHLHGILLTSGAGAIGIGMFYALGAGTNAGIATSTGIAATFCAIYYAFKVLPLSAFWRLAGAGNVLRLPDIQISKPVEPGHFGIALSDLRPCGIVMIEGCRYSARSIDGYKSAGTDITVIDVRNHEIVVTEVRQKG